MSKDPPSNLFASKQVSFWTRCARYAWHRQDFPLRAQYVYEQHFHGAKSWPLCCISPSPAPSAIALPHRKWLKRTHEVLNSWNSKNLKWWSHMFKFWYITQLSHKRKIHNSRASTVKLRVVLSQIWQTWNPEPRTWLGFQTEVCSKPNSDKWCDDVTKSSHFYPVPGKWSHFWKH